MSKRSTIQLLQTIKELCNEALEHLQPGGVYSPTARKGKGVSDKQKDAVIVKFRASQERKSKRS